MRKKRTFNKKPLCAILAISLMAASLSGCGKKNKGNESNVIEEASKSSKDYVFRAEELDIGIKTDNFRSLGLYNGRIHAVSGDTNILRFISFNPDGSDVKDFTVPETENEGHNEFAYDSEGNVDYSKTVVNGTTLLETKMVTTNPEDPRYFEDVEFDFINLNSDCETFVTGSDQVFHRI